MIFRIFPSGLDGSALMVSPKEHYRNRSRRNSDRKTRGEETAYSVPRLASSDDEKRPSLGEQTDASSTI
jgi:hypothetical protein